MQNNKSHIVIFVPGFAADEQDENCIPSIQYYVMNLKKVAPEKTISIVTFEYPFLKNNYTWQGIHVYAIGGAGRKNFWKLLTWFRVLVCFIKLNNKQPVTSIQSFWLRECTLIGLFISKIFAVNFVATLQGQESQKGNWYLKIFNFFKIRVVSNSQFNAAVYAQSTGKACESIIPFGVEYDQIYARCPYTNSARPIDIIGLGSLLPVKNYKLFIEIIAELKKELPSIKALVIGGGPQLIMLKQKVISAGLSENIEFKGFVESRNKALNYLASSKILLHTSTHEGQCYTFMEAFAYGLELVAFNVGHIPDSRKSHICASKEEMIASLKKLLSAPIDTSVEIIGNMKESAEQFNKLLI